MQNKDLNSHMFEGVYKDLDIDLNKLGCLMIDTESIVLPSHTIQDWDSGAVVNFDAFFKSFAYYAKDKARFWIDGFVSDKTPHITLLYGFLKPALEYKSYIQEVLKDWKMETVKISHLSYFNSPYADEDYYCIVAHIEVTPELLEGHQRLEFLPHVNTFNGYKPHITIAYIKKDDAVRDEFIKDMDKMFKGKELKVIGLNYGGNK